MNEDYKNSTKTKIVLMVVFVLLIGIVVYSIIRLTGVDNPYGEGMPINNLSQSIDAISADQIQNLQHQLYEIVEKNNGDPTAHDAMVRVDSITNEKNGGVLYTSFVVDIDSLRQSYYVQIEKPVDKSASSGYPLLLTCVYDKKLIIYNDFECVDDFSSDTQGNSQSFAISKYLPATQTLPSGTEYTISLGGFDNEKQSLDILVESCSKEGMTDELVAAVKKWVNSLGLDADDFDYNISLKYNRCLVE